MSEHRHPEEVSATEALRALPLETPSRSAWPALADELARRRRRAPRWPWALAAGLALALALPLALRAPQAPAPAGSDLAGIDAAATDAWLAPLLAESARLEALLQLGPGDASSTAGVAVIAASLQDRIALIDRALADPGLDANDQFPLWQARVSALRQLAGIEGTRQWLAARGEAYEGALFVSL